jgi:hypothetical protein
MKVKTKICWDGELVKNKALKMASRCCKIKIRLKSEKSEFHRDKDKKFKTRT